MDTIITRTLDNYLENIKPDKNDCTRIGCSHIKKYNRVAKDIRAIEVSDGVVLWLCHLCYGSIQEYMLKELTHIKVDKHGF